VKGTVAQIRFPLSSLLKGKNNRSLIQARLFPCGSALWSALTLPIAGKKRRWTNWTRLRWYSHVPHAAPAPSC